MFQPIQVGDMKLAHRVVMAPLTRLRGTEEHNPGSSAALYYEQRSEAPGTLIISETALISEKGGCYPGITLINTEEQIAGWKTVVDAVHAKGSFIYLQLGSVGRPGGVLGASDIPLAGQVPAPRSLTHSEIKEFTEFFVTSAYNAVHKAGFDGVEIHGANGYLVDQFTQSNSNNRTDAYGGSVANRSRFALEIISAVARVVGDSKTGVRFSPWSTFQEMLMPAPERLAQFSHLVEEIKRAHPELAYLHLVSPRANGTESKSEGDVREEHFQEMSALRELWGQKPLIIAGGMDREIGLGIAEKYAPALVAYGRHFLANPDLVQKLKEDLPLTKGNRDTYYTPGPEGYVDYPFLDASRVGKAAKPTLH
ncbi:NADH:flavin oxidoreductase/NADH oxidase [Athelia psychrophila]|uniref:NADH:flavin oxidoreductase/NADH oxidase n=1 Tax=Athelia psychrophila TaxID=1759441 RepID=A0A166NHX8_9AGAM|nr:NADH:flavin oxidoreductase/NADH oxidase [Fibularhizoctonia sp. CBS 109695]